MKNKMFQSALLTITLSLLLVSVAAAQTTPPWTSYSPPTSSYTGLDAVGSYQYYDDQFDDDRGNVNHGTLKLRYWQFMDSPSFGYDINAALTAQTKGLADGSERTVDLDLNSGGHSSLKYYLSPGGDAFGYFGLTGSAADLDLFSMVANVGVGYGRFRDVTPLGRAAEIERALMNIGDVTRNFGPQFLVLLAQETERIPAAEETSAERTQRIAEFITNNAPGQPVLSPAGVITVDEQLSRSVLRRSIGWEARAGVGYPVILPEGDERTAQAVASVSFGMPVAYGTQINLTAQASSPFEGLMETYTVGVQGEVVHTVNENFDVGANVSANFNGYEIEDDIVSWSLGAFADFQILQSLTLVTTMQFSDATERAGIWEQPAVGFTTALRYRFF